MNHSIQVENIFISILKINKFCDITRTFYILMFIHVVGDWLAESPQVDSEAARGPATSVDGPHCREKDATRKVGIAQFLCRL